MAQIKAFIFDMDGTILDSMGYWRGENRLFLSRRGLAVPDDLADDIDIISSRAFAKRFVAEYGAPYTVESVVREYELEMVSHYQTEILPKKGAEAYLAALKGAGMRLCVATATPRATARMALDRHGLLKYFDFVTDEAETGVSKAKKEFFWAVCARMGAAADETVVFEDSLYAMQAAKEAGTTVYGIEERVHTHFPEKMQGIRETVQLFVRDFDEALEQAQTTILA